ncbi:MAG: histidinol dehydrogenase [Erysipelotrichaceae bacterium]|nr:histidinol dehydrogenase [Erysipelotrichaceae bacterium]MCI9523733.1 histidinol dehydrogenase [Erysipelotrichaceae bacterium]
MLKQFDKKDRHQIQKWIQKRSDTQHPDVTKAVLNILESVKTDGDQALINYTKQFDHVFLTSLEVTSDEINAAYAQVDKAFIDDMEQAKENIIFFHEAQKKQGFELQKENGVYLGQRILPLQRVGVYVPGGRAAYPSSVLMNVLPARIAGVEEIIMVTPPNKDGSIDPYIAAAAKIAGVDRIFKVGGAQAIAALAYGSTSIPKVDKIVGPGNIYVATAKQLVYGKVDIDMIAGPSEILVIADEDANPSFVAADLISQAEHDPMASSILLTPSSSLAKQVIKEVQKQADELPKKEIIYASFQNFGAIMILETIEECIQISNEIAPEHLELMVKDAKQYLHQIQNAGSVFLGYYTCESIGDYFGGTNHVLPTSGTARFYSALNVDNFVKKSSYLYWSEDALKKDGEKIIHIANQEKLQGHANAVKVRLKQS